MLSVKEEKIQKHLVEEELLPGEVVEDEVACGFLSYTKIYTWFIGIIVFLISCIFMLIIAFQQLLPLKEVKPVYIGLDMGDDKYVYELIPVETIDGRLSIAKYFLRQFMEDWGTIDRVLENNRIDRIFAMTTEQVFKEFMRVRDSKERDPKTGNYVGLHHIPGFKREIKILRDAMVQQRGDERVHEIDFQTIDTNSNNPGNSSVREWNAKIAYEFQPLKVRFEEDGSMLNPAGIIVFENTITETYREKVK